MVNKARKKGQASLKSCTLVPHIIIQLEYRVHDDSDSSSMISWYSMDYDSDIL